MGTSRRHVKRCGQGQVVHMCKIMRARASRVYWETSGRQVGDKCEIRESRMFLAGKQTRTNVKSRGPSPFQRSKNPSQTCLGKKTCIYTPQNSPPAKPAQCAIRCIHNHPSLEFAHGLVRLCARIFAMQQRIEGPVGPAGLGTARLRRSRDCQALGLRNVGNAQLPRAKVGPVHSVQI